MELLLTCLTTVIINTSGEPWNNRDNRSMSSAKVTCYKLYNGCLVKFTKTEPLVYRAICGKPK